MLLFGNGIRLECTVSDYSVMLEMCQY